MIDKNELFISRLEDYYSKSELGGYVKFIGFLDEYEKSAALSFLSKRNKNCFMFFGGYECSVREFLCIHSDDIPVDKDMFPINPISFFYRESDVLSHRDFLGAMMSLGIKRESIGDILVSKGSALAFLSDTASKLVVNEINKIGRVGVTVKKGMEAPVSLESSFEKQSYTVASNRLDCIVAAVSKVSRNTALEMINNSLVFVNGIETKDQSKKVSESSVLTIRKKGKYIVDSLSEQNKKGRLRLKIRKYK
jgi:RNA-binding protein YlmH